MSREKWLICASGPSISETDFAMVRRFTTWNVIAVNNTWELMPWADILYAGDIAWWDRYGGKARRFKGEKAGTGTWTLG